MKLDTDQLIERPAKGCEMDLRVLHVFKTYWPDTFGGIERVIFEICENTSRHGIGCDVLTVSHVPTGGDFRPLSTHRYVSYKRDLNLAGACLSLGFLLNFRKLARSYDIVHYHYPWPLMDAAQIVTSPGTPYVVTYHSDIVRRKALKLLVEPVSSRFLAGAAEIVATSKRYAQTSPLLTGRELKIIPIGLSESGYPRLDLTDRVRRVIENGRPYVLSVGVNRHYKGLDWLIDLSSEIKSPVVIASAGPAAQALESRMDANQARNVTLLRDATEGEKVALLQNAAVFAFPSRNRAEAYGLSLVEAAMAGKPMVSTEVGSGTSFVNRNGQTGIVVPADDPRAFCGAINELLSKPDTRSAMGEAARNRFLAEFTGRMMGDRYARLYRGL